jgi:hypothetical protein
MNKKRVQILMYYACYLVLMFSLALIYQVSHPHDPPQTFAVSAQKALAIFVSGQVSLFGFTMIAIFGIWFITAKTPRRKKGYSN